MKRAYIFALLALFASTTHSYGEELRTIECELKPIPHSAVHHEVRNAPHVASTETSSQNWAGYAAETNFSRPLTGSVTHVAGTWVVPTLHATQGDTYSSIWVGIDGYSSASVEQLGTEHDWSNGRQTNYAWFELYPQDAYEISGFPVNPGDVISAQVTYVSNNQFNLSITNYTENVTSVIPQSRTKVAGTKRTSAEWVVEAPFAGEILPLSDFGTVAFTNCEATINGVTGSINNAHWQNVDIVMESNTINATPSALSSNGEAFTVTWHHE